MAGDCAEATIVVVARHSSIPGQALRRECHRVLSQAGDARTASVLVKSQNGGPGWPHVRRQAREFGRLGELLPLNRPHCAASGELGETTLAGQLRCVSLY